MKIIGVTGPSGSGKSILSEHWRKSGFVCLDADKIYHEMLLPPSPCLDAIASTFGSELLSADGTLNRKALAEKVFENPDALKRLNETVLPLVIDEIKRRIHHASAHGEKAVILDAPTLIESGFHRSCDAVIAVIAPKEARLARIMERDAMDRDAAMQRLAAQKDETFYRAASDYVLLNDKTPEMLCEQADKILCEVLGL